MTRAGRALVALALAGCGAGVGTPAPARVFDAREEVVRIGTFADIAGVAVSTRYAYVVAEGSLAAYDRQFRRWLPPIPLEQDLAAGPARLVAADPLEDAVWIASSGVVRYVRLFPMIGSTALVPGMPTAMMFDGRDPVSGAYVAAGGAWTLVSRSGSAVRVSTAQLPPPDARVVVPTLRSVLAQYPSLRNFAPLLTRDEQLRSWPVTAAAPAPDENVIWVGTRGGGLFRVDPVFNRSEQMAFGLLSEGAGAIAAVETDRVAVAGLGLPGSRDGITVLSRDLQEWRWLERGAASPLAGARAYDMASSGDALWVATDRGLVRASLRDPGDLRLSSTAAGLPASEALAVAAVAGGAWVGTTRGAVLVADDARQARRVAGPVLASGIPVRALVVTGDTLWLGTDAGLLAVSPALPGGTLRRLTTGLDEPRLARPIAALAAADSVVVAITDREILQVHRASGRVTTPAPTVGSDVIAPVAAAAMDATTIWIVGGRGVLVVDRASGVRRVLGAGVHVPAAAYDVLLDPQWAWIATREGLIRMQRTSDGMPR